MAELNEKQLMLLDSLVYLDCGFPEGMTVGQLVTQLQKPGALDQYKFGEGLTKEEAADMLKNIAADEALCGLTITNSVDGDIRAACFVDGAGDAVIAYRGTGPVYLEWDDDFQGGYLSDTDMQEQALDFARECAIQYDDITVTGHSKGGNMAQYVTVRMGDEIDRCVSFDGQGFSDEFLRKYEDEIEANQGKIRNVCSYNDYVNILLTSIAGETVYLATDNEWFPGGHYLYDLYTHSDNVLDENGEFVSSREQSGLLKTLAVVEEKAVQLLDTTSPFQEFLVYTLLGAVVGGLMGDDASLLGMLDAAADNFKDFLEHSITKWIRGKKDVSVSVTVDTPALRNYGSTMSAAARQMRDMRSRIRALQKKMATNIISGVTVGAPLQAVLLQLDSECTKLEKLAVVLDECADRYDTAETTAVNAAT